LFWVLFAAHLIGDYLLQPDWLVRKRREGWGALLHAGVHFVVMLIAVGRNSTRLYPILLTLAAAHYAIDALKMKVLIPRMRGEVGPFLSDAAVHMITLGVASAWIERMQPVAALPLPQAWYVLGSGYLLATYSWYIIERLFAGSSRALRDEVIAQAFSRMFVRACLVTVLLGIGRGYMGIALLGTMLPYRNPRWRKRALVTDALVSTACAGLMLLGLTAS
jgi:hypothetical protein